MSPLIYSGKGLTGTIGFERIKASRSMLIQLSHGRGALRNAPGHAADYLGFALKNHTFYHRNTEPDGHLLWGWSNNNVLGSYTHRSFANFGSRSFYFTSFGPSTHYQYGFTLWNRDFLFRVLADMQLLGFYLRPSYVSGSPEGYLDPDRSDIGAFLHSIKPFIPGNTWNFGINPSIRFHFHSGNAISMEYRFEYVRINTPEPVTSAAGNWMIQMIILL